MPSLRQRRVRAISLRGSVNTPRWRASKKQGRPANEPHAARRSARRDTGVRAPPRAGVRRGPPGWSVLAGERRPLRGLWRSEEHTSELQSRLHLVCRLLLEKKKKKQRKE